MCGCPRTHHRKSPRRWAETGWACSLIPGSIDRNQVTFLTESVHVPLEELRRGGTGEAT
jgi:hypothetical protein